MTWCELSRLSKLHIHYELSFVWQGIVVCSRLEAISLSSAPLLSQFAVVGLDDFDREKKGFLFLSFFFFSTLIRVISSFEDQLGPWVGGLWVYFWGLIIFAQPLAGRIPPPNVYVYVHMCTCMYVYENMYL